MRILNSLIVSSLALGGFANAQPSPTPAVAPLPAVRPPGLSIAPEAPLMLAQSSKAADPRGSRRVPTEDESLALAAMEGLMSQSPARALPVIKKVLAGTQSTLVKERALFVLSQMDEPEAQTLLLGEANSVDSPLRREAIRNIGIGGNAKSLAGLQGIYTAGDTSVKKQVLEAWLIAGKKADVYQAALNAKSEAEASNAIRTLSAMGAVDELRKLGEAKKHGNSLIEAYAVAGDLVSLRKIADGAGELPVRAEAIRRIGIVDGDGARAALRQIYASNTAPRLKDAALQGLLISNDQQGVLALYRAAKSNEEKRALLRTLSIMGGDAALQAIDAALDGTK
ncbi:MAG: hypothetical protein ABL931_10865 [Usitatibacteraceae bacterium]